MKRRVFVLGAGCSSHCFDGLVTANLFERVAARCAGLLDWKDTSDLYRFLRYLYPTRSKGVVDLREVNVEDLLSSLEAAINFPEISEKGVFKKSRLENIFRTVQHGIVRLLFPAGSTEDGVYREFARKLSPMDVVISFNYDIELERALARELKKELPLFYFWHKNLNQPAVLKLHGSVNWVDEGPKKRALAEDFCESHDYVILAPTMFKRPERVSAVWHSARLALMQAEEIWFVGYSLPTADIAARYLIRRGVRMMLKKRPGKIFVVNPDPAVLQRYLTQIHHKVEYEKMKFEEFAKFNFSAGRR